MASNPGTNTGSTSASVDGSRYPTDNTTFERDEVRVGDEALTGRRDRVRWGPIWAGLVVAIATYLLLQLLLVALDVVELGGGDTNDAVFSSVAALVAFFLGGVTAGASAMWRGSDDGVLHGILMWAVGLVVIVVLAGVGSGLALGSIDTSRAFDDFRTTQSQDVDQANDTAKEAAGRAVAGIVAALAAAAVGGAIGSKLWPKDIYVDRNERTSGY